MNNENVQERSVSVELETSDIKNGKEEFVRRSYKLKHLQSHVTVLQSYNQDFIKKSKKEALEIRMIKAKNAASPEHNKASPIRSSNKNNSVPRDVNILHHTFQRKK